MATVIVPTFCLLCKDFPAVQRVMAPMKPLRNDVTGQQFGRLTVQHFFGILRGEVTWCCACLCGMAILATVTPLRSGHTKSCGCFQREARDQTKHGMRHTLAYKRWANMIQRCTNPRNNNFLLYGGRGIIVCDRWRHSFADFYTDMGDPPQDMTLERKDVNGPYSPENCVWDTWTQQRINQRQTIYHSYNGETHHIREWSNLTGIRESTLSARLRNLGWDIAKALTTPVSKSSIKRSALETTPQGTLGAWVKQIQEAPQ